MHVSKTQTDVFYPVLKTLRLTEQVKKIKEVQTLFDNILFYILATTWALRAFQEKKYAKFDALVGETACQLRASQVADLAKAYLCKAQFKNEVDACLNYFEHALRRLKIVRELFNRCVHCLGGFNKLFPGGLSYGSLAERFELNLNMPNDIAFLVCAYLLHETKGELDADSVNFYSSKEFTTVDQLLTKCNESQCSMTKSGLSKFIGEVQKCVSELSVRYLYGKAEEFETLGRMNQEPSLSRLLKQYTVKDEFDRTTTACFYNMKVVWKNVLVERHPFVLHVCRWTDCGKYVDSIRFTYKATDDGQNLVLDTTIPKEDAPVVFMHAVSVDKSNDVSSKEKYAQRLASYNIMELLDANWSLHAQFPGKKNASLELEPDAEKSRLEKFALETGCCKQNKTLLLAIHMFCDTYKNATNRDKML